jgi:hypothetical protein
VRLDASDTTAFKPGFSRELLNASALPDGQQVERVSPLIGSLGWSPGHKPEIFAKLQRTRERVWMLAKVPRR